MAKRATAAKTSERRTGDLVPQRHGGALRHGGTNRGGPGSPPSALRERLRGSFEERVPIIEMIADGQVVQKTRVRLIDMLPHVTCANCGEKQMSPSDPDNAADLEIDAMISASPRDRLAAMDLKAKYGLGQLKEISVESVRERVANTLAVIREHVAPELYQTMLPALRAQWS